MRRLFVNFNLLLVYFLCLFTSTNGCWRKSSNVPELTSTPTATPLPAVKEQSGNIQTADGARSNLSQSGLKIEPSELKSISEELFQLDTNSIGSQLTLNHQGLTSLNDKSDVAPQPLFSGNVIPPSSKTFSLFEKLLDNYVADVRRQEENTKAENIEVNDFLDEVMNTKVMKRLEEFLKSKGLLKDTLRRQLYFIWFTPYTRSKGVIGSSGFEHVFLGEIKSGEVTGFHNWLQFQREEQERDVNYKGYVKKIDLGSRGEILKMKFDWMNYQKSVGSMFVGTSPELEMALYTLCFYARGNVGCNLQLNGKKIRIKIYQQLYNGRKIIGSAFPEVY